MDMVCTVPARLSPAAGRYCCGIQSYFDSHTDRRFPYLYCYPNANIYADTITNHYADPRTARLSNTA